jgi:hypothetical protein
MRELRFVNTQCHSPDGVPMGRSSMFTVMDQEGRVVASQWVNKEGGPRKRYTFYPNTSAWQRSYPLSERRVR